MAFHHWLTSLQRTMANRTTIEWTNATWNPVTGCDKVSPGCAHCYAETLAERFRGVAGHPYEQGFDLKLWPERLEACGRPSQYLDSCTLIVSLALIQNWRDGQSVGLRLLAVVCRLADSRPELYRALA